MYSCGVLKLVVVMAGYSRCRFLLAENTGTNADAIAEICKEVKF
jgi:hypothetical protein